MASSCEFDFMEYIDEDSIDPNLMCSICHKPFQDPVCTPCDHTYGRACITHWLTQSVKYSCPTCVRQPLLIKDLTQANRPLRNMLDQLRVRCALCEQTGLQRGNFVDHINKICPKATVQCQAADIRCPWKGLRDELDSHMSICVFEPLRPVLATLIAENKQLMDQVRNHDNEIKELTTAISQLKDDSDNESDISSVLEKEEDAIYIRNLPSTVKFNEIFDLFSKIGRITYNRVNKKTGIFIFKNSNNKDGFNNAKVTYVDKDSVAAAIAEYNHKHIPQWNTQLLVSKFTSDPRRKNFRDVAKSNNENIGARQDSKARGGGETICSVDEQPQPLMAPNQPTSKKNRRAPQHYPRQDDKPTS